MTIIVLFLPTGSGEKIENTMEAFTQWVSLLLYLLPLFLPPSYYLLISSCDSAVSAGTEMLEMDCHLTSDGYVVISHDSNLMRQTGYDQTVSSLRFQVVILTLNFLFSSSYDSWWSLNPILYVSGLASLWRATRGHILCW